MVHTVKIVIIECIVWFMKGALAMTKQEIKGNRDELRTLYDRIGLSENSLAF